MKRLYYLTDEPFAQINRRPPPPVKTRAALEGSLPRLRTGPPWRQLPPAAGPWPPLYRRGQRWLERGVWGDMLRLLKRLKGMDRKRIGLASPVVPAHQHPAAAATHKGIRPAAVPAAE